MRTNIDGWLIDRVFDPIAHHVQARTGITHYALSRFALIPYGANGLSLAWGDPSTFSILIVFMTILGVGFGVLNTWIGEKMFPSKPGTASWFRMNGFWQFLRGVWIAFFVKDIVALLIAPEAKQIPGLASSLGFLCHVYFLACSAMPPSLPREIAERRAQRGRLATVQT